jgi:hypothetical protein
LVQAVDSAALAVGENAAATHSDEVATAAVGDGAAAGNRDVEEEDSEDDSEDDDDIQVTIGDIKAQTYEYITIKRCFRHLDSFLQ